MTTPRRYRLDPFFTLTGWSMNQVSKVAPAGGAEYRNRLSVGVTERVADRLATAAGHHPHSIWPEMAEEAAADAARADAEKLERRRQQARDSARRRYREDAEVRERRKAHAKAWREANQRTLRHHPSRQPEARIEQGRAYYERHKEQIKAKRRERWANDAERRAMKLAEMRTRYHHAKNEGNNLHQIDGREAMSDRDKTPATAHQNAHTATSGPAPAQAGHDTIEHMIDQENAA